MLGNRRIQKARPKPFQRPGIELSDPHARREWMDIPADDVAIGDTIPDFGVVAALSKVSSINTVIIVSAAGKQIEVIDGGLVKAFHLVG